MNFIRGQELGHGTFAKVNLASTKNNETPPFLAIKSCGVSHAASLMHEKSILQELTNCPEIITCFGETISFENGEKLYNVLLEYAPGGDLHSKLKKEGRFHESKVREYTKALLKGLNYIHKAGYVHCDLKLQNVLLCQNGIVKIADFGLAKRNEDVLKTKCDLRGTPLYMSPEMVVKGEQGGEADIWALGCLVTEMVSGNSPWRFSDVAGLLMRIGVGDEVPEVSEILSEEGRDFVSKCFVKDPRERWTAEMLLDHPFVSEYGREVRNFGSEDEVLKKDFIIGSTCSPKCPFDFPDWVSSSVTSGLPEDCSTDESGLWFVDESSSSSEAKRLSGLVCGNSPDWSVSEDWVIVR